MADDSRRAAGPAATRGRGTPTRGRRRRMYNKDNNIIDKILKKTTMKNAIGIHQRTFFIDSSVWLDKKTAYIGLNSIPGYPNQDNKFRKSLSAGPRRIIEPARTNIISLSSDLQQLWAGHRTNSYNLSSWSLKDLSPEETKFMIIKFVCMVEDDHTTDTDKEFV